MQPRWLLVVAFLLAGCLGPPDQAVAPDATPVALPHWDCPAGGAPVGGLCAATLSRAPDLLAEPYVAVHPHDPDILVVGANIQRPTSVGVTGGQAAATPLGVDLFLSRDGGASWSRLEPPLTGVGPGPTAQAGLAVDPAFAFDAHGTLHYTALVQGAVPRNAPPLLGGFGIPFNEVSYTASGDLGQTWTPATMLSQGDGLADRNWLAVTPNGTVVVTWQRFTTGSSSVAWNGGAEWRQADLPCTMVSSPLAFDDHVEVVCTAYEDGAARAVHPWRVDLADGSAQRGVATGLQCTFATLARHGMQLVAACNQGQAILIVNSLDGGATWSAPLDAGASWNAGPTLKFMRMDNAGRVHLLSVHDAEATHSVAAPNGTLLAQARWPFQPSSQLQNAPDHYWGLDVSMPFAAGAVTNGDDVLVYRVDLGFGPSPPSPER